MKKQFWITKTYGMKSGWILPKKHKNPPPRERIIDKGAYVSDTTMRAFGIKLKESQVKLITLISEDTNAKS